MRNPKLKSGRKYAAGKNLFGQIIHSLLFTAVICLLAAGSPMTVRASSVEKADWTVMIYLCGSDLESKYGLATYNLEEMDSIDPQFTVKDFLNATYDIEQEDEPLGKVNVVLETGGCKEWHAKESLDLEAALKAFEEGKKTAEQCRKMLEEAELKLKDLRQAEND